MIDLCCADCPMVSPRGVATSSLFFFRSRHEEVPEEFTPPLRPGLTAGDTLWLLGLPLSTGADRSLLRSRPRLRSRSTPPEAATPRLPPGLSGAGVTSASFRAPGKPPPLAEPPLGIVVRAAAPASALCAFFSAALCSCRARCASRCFTSSSLASLSALSCSIHLAAISRSRAFFILSAFLNRSSCKRRCLRMSCNFSSFVR
mmetsp:Transcript_140033/g.247477  ORF Transcript_140033/g.247477 Transcript_140033/m.247477 type:complete len:202 (+) Transcript_140033:722-1327(+)